MFDEIISNYTGSDYIIKIKEITNPYQAKSFPILILLKPALKNEVDEFAKIRVKNEHFSVVSSNIYYT